MNNGLQTEEFRKKKNYKPFIMIAILMLVIGFIIYGIYIYMGYREEKQKNEKNKIIINPLNEELADIYGFAISDNYIVAIKKDGSYVKIYNLLQGTGNYGDFTTYAYYDKALYLLYSDHVLYTISLNRGNRLYELVKYSDLETVSCQDGTTGKANDLAFTKNSIYVNNSNCSVIRIKEDTKTKKKTTELLRNFNNQNVNMEYSSVINSLFIYGDQNIIKIDNHAKEVVTVASDIASYEKMLLKSNILIYSKIENNVKSYYGYNVSNNVNNKIVDADRIILYKKSFIYMKNNKIYVLTNGKEKEIYIPHYAVLSDMELIGEDTLQVVDSTIDKEKSRIVNINLKSKSYDITYNNMIFTNIIEYSR